MKNRYRVRLPIRSVGDPGFYVAGFLDMLRYDGSTVETWDRDRDARGNAIFVVTLASESFTPDRWSSMGLTAEVLS